LLTYLVQHIDSISLHLYSSFCVQDQMAELEAALASSKREAERLKQELNLECSENKSRGLLQHLMDEKAKRVRTRTSQDRMKTKQLRTQLTALEIQASTP
jgi:hypothetical protein